jgi:hypothetical protein
MYLRFVVHQIDEYSHGELDMFPAVRYLRDEGKLHSDEEERHDAIRDSSRRYTPVC